MLPGLLNGMRVLMTADAVGGIWTYALDLGRGLVARGARVTLAVLGPPPDAPRRAAADLAGLEVVALGHPPEWLATDKAEVAEAAADLARLAGERRADLLHLNHPALAALASLPCPALGVSHSCVATWWEAVRGTPLPGDFAWRTALVGRGYRELDALVAPSRAFAEATQRLYDLSALPDIIHNGRPPCAPAAGPVDPGGIVSAGRLWDEGKGMSILDEAAGRVTAPVTVVGPLLGPNGSRICFRHAAALGPLGEADTLDALQRHAIYAAPSLYEPFGLSVLEAAQAGCALILTEIPTFRELWDEAALFVPPRDGPALARAMEVLAADGARLTEMRGRARARATRYGVDRFVEAYAALYARLLSRSQVAGSAA